MLWDASGALLCLSTTTGWSKSVQAARLLPVMHVSIKTTRAFLEIMKTR